MILWIGFSLLLGLLVGAYAGFLFGRTITYFEEGDRRTQSELLRTGHAPAWLRKKHARQEKE